jgi:hypothetical protein
MIKASTLGANITTNAAAVATAITGCTTAEAQALGDLLTILSRRADLLLTPLQLSVVAKTGINLG